MDIVKCEVLWTRMCPLKCEYCAMATGRANSITVNEFRKGVLNLKSLGCKFMAFYGAEPLEDFYKLPAAIKAAEENGIATTVITSGVTPYFHYKLDVLYKMGLRSLTMSYDIDGLGKWSDIKTSKAMEGLKYFGRLGPIRDKAVVVTLTHANYKNLIPTIEEMSHRGIWTFFDFIHSDRKQPGSKCKSVDYHLLFDEGDYPELRKVLTQVVDMKAAGYLCHSSRQFIGLISDNDFDLIREYNWNCAKEPDFPAWVTMDCDGNMYCCDDFQIYDGRLFHVTNLLDEWKEFKEYWRPQVLEKCPGCCWNTHIDAHLVKRGEVPITDYVHGLGGV